MIKNPRQATHLTPITKGFRKMLDSGRAGLYGICNGDRHALVVFNLYGWTGSHDDLEAQGRTADLVRICLAELRARNVIYRPQLCPRGY